MVWQASQLWQTRPVQTGKVQQHLAPAFTIIIRMPKFYVQKFWWLNRSSSPLNLWFCIVMVWQQLTWQVHCKYGLYGNTVFTCGRHFPKHLRACSALALLLIGVLFVSMISPGPSKVQYSTGSATHLMAVAAITAYPAALAVLIQGGNHGNPSDRLR